MTPDTRNIEASIVADSINPDGKRITTFVVKYPRFIHSEIMTHRQFSRNAASSRAIPTSKIISAVNKTPAMPEWWGANQKGMQAVGQVDTLKIEACQDNIGFLRDRAVASVKELNELGLHKQIANRYLEPWFHITVLITATDWGNFFALRAHPDAQPEFQILAYRMLDLYLKNEPTKLGWREWHIPLAKTAVEEPSIEKRLVESVANCARTSYTTQDKDYTYEAQLKLRNTLKESGHWSPFEHQAMADKVKSMSGNFRGGWSQHRHEAQFKTDPKDRLSLEQIMETKPDWFDL